MSDDEKLLKTGTAAEFLGVPHRTFQRWAKEGKLIPDVVSDGGHNFFSEETCPVLNSLSGKTRHQKK